MGLCGCDCVVFIGLLGLFDALVSGGWLFVVWFGCIDCGLLRFILHIDLLLGLDWIGCISCGLIVFIFIFIFIVGLIIFVITLELYLVF